MFRCYSYTIIREHISLFLLNLQLYVCMLHWSAGQSNTNKDLIYAATPPLY